MTAPEIRAIGVETLMIPHNPTTNPRGLPWQSWVCGFHVGYHKTESAARRAARIHANKAARISGGSAPDAAVRKVVFPP